MMKFLMMMVFMMPLCFMNFWLFQSLFFILFFLCLMNLSYGFEFMNISYSMSWDLLSFTLVLLSFWVCSLMVLASEKIYKIKNYYNVFLLVMLLLMISLYIAFSSMNLFLFYLFFEISLIPTLILIVGWGYQPERIEAGIYLLFYTLLASLPMMLMIFYYYKNYYTLDFYFMNFQLENIYMFILFNLVFLIKVPMYMLHLWLPKAHVEAPVSGSMILAGIMLKLGGYGMMRLMYLFMKIYNNYNIYLIMISMLGGVIVSLICIRQVDIKSLIAYSSVAHMGFVLSGIMTFSLWGLWGSLVMMLAHGLCSSGLFCLANIIYERSNTRSLYLNKGMMNLMPSLSLWWFLFCSSNMAAPPSLNLLGEMMLINSLVSFSKNLMLFIFFISFFSAVYSLYLFSFSQHGIFSKNLKFMYMIYFREYLLLFLHWIPLNLLILKLDFFVIWI
uniref:NADH-ubiquinone oxidoreductase chain 4 n=1 Tax=Monotoma quadricollis TaxID=346807 RepID=A0A343A3P2_9CUCU|nr:NADH dehydrogenase subunit 4 [Monotoma quadricollis]AOY39170.1 NADH dehydrogenase subunit 4 [Monotoma quadricollis]